jgi:hypothetical protein
MNVTNSNLEFRKVPSLKFLYEINSNGTILRNVKSKKQLLIKLDMHHSDRGYYVSFVHNPSVCGDKNKVKRVMIHRIVAECWHGPCPDGYEVDHRDRNPHNNDYRNLRYVTKSEQMKNRDHSGISLKGTENFEKARAERMKPVRIYNESEEHIFNSFADTARFLGNYYDKDPESMRARLKGHRAKIFDFNIEYIMKCRD